MGKFRKKPVVIEAVQFMDTSEAIEAMSDFVADEIAVDYRTDPPELSIDTLEGTLVAQVGDWIIRGVAGEYPCKPDIFEQTYDAVED